MTSAEQTIARIVRESDATATASELREQFSEFLWTGDGPFPDHVRDDPHALGWLQQYLGEAERQRAFAAHTGREAKHTSATTTTQLYTPRWVADWLASRCFEIAGPEASSVLDPACGGGQMLLAAAAALQERGCDPVTAFAALRGRDLDPDAVWAARESLKLAAARALGARHENVEATIDANIVVGDGLAATLEPADVVLTNPPYMGARSMPENLRSDLRAFAPYHHDLYLAFIRHCCTLGRAAVGILAPQTIWYLTRFEPARLDLLERGRLRHFAHLGAGVFGALTGEKATVVAFTWQPDGEPKPTEFWDLRAVDDRARAIAEEPQRMNVADLRKIPGAPLAFWLPRRLVTAFDGLRLGEVATVPGSQNKTGANARFVRPIDEAPADWVPYSKGGRFAPWWGNWDWAVDWSDEARAFYRDNRTSNLLAEPWWFREGLCYSDFGGRDFNARWMPPGCVFDMAGPAIFVDEDDVDLLAALLVVLNSTAARQILNALNPTLHFQVRDVRNLPLPAWDDHTIVRLAGFGHELVAQTRAALENGGMHPRELEAEADAVVAHAYGCPALAQPATERRVHHRL